VFVFYFVLFGSTVDDAKEKWLKDVFVCVCFFCVYCFLVWFGCTVVDAKENG
jgi:hypothetical protein